MPTPNQPDDELPASVRRSLDEDTVTLYNRPRPSFADLVGDSLDRPPSSSLTVIVGRQGGKGRELRDELPPIPTTIGGDIVAEQRALTTPAQPRRGPQASPNTELHPATGLRPGGHWACRRPDPNVVSHLTAFDFTCPDCRQVAEAVERVKGADTGFVTRTRSGLEVPTELGVSDLLASTRRHNPEGKDHWT
jgi:hypothetical protein